MQPPSHLEIRSKLGAGGMGTVYEAFDRERNELVALKVVTQLEPGAALRFRREFSAMARLSHPNILRVYDLFEDEEGNPAYTMEIIRGGDLLKLLKQMRAAFEPQDAWKAGAEAILKLLRPLEALHQAGLVHRDLKPANVLLTEDGVVKLSDFGLAVPTGFLGVRGKVVGTPAYMSPEQILGQELDLRADLYSVGVMLFEFLAGKRPFNPPDVADLLRHHLALAAPRLEKILPNLPPGLSDLVARSLSKRPSDRWSSAAELALHLTMCLGGSGSSSDAGSGFESSTRSKLFRPQFSGRALQLQEFNAAVEETQQGRTRVLLVHGRFGSGKSRFLEEAEARLRIAGLTTFRQTHPASTSEPYGMARSILGRLLELTDGTKPEDSSLAPLRRLIRPSSIRGTLETERDPLAQLVVATAGLLKRLSQAQGFALLLDDLQSADEASRRLWSQVTQHLLRQQAGDKPACLLVLALDADDPAAGAFGAGLAADPKTANLRLDPMEFDEIGQVLRSMLSSEELPAGLQAHVFEASDGHAGFTETYAHWLTHRGWLHFEERWKFQLPPDGSGYQDVGRGLFHGLLQTRLEGLGAEDLRLLRVAGILGGTTPYWLLLQAHGNRSPRAMVALDTLVRRGLLRELEEERLALFHPSAAGLLQEMTPADEREEVTKRAIRGLCDQPNPNALERAILAELAEKAGKDELAAEMHLALGVESALLHANVQARSHLQKARDAAARGKTAAAPAILARAELELGTLLVRLGELEAARRNLESARTVSQDESLEPYRGRILDRLGLAALRTGQLDAAFKLFQEARDHAMRTGDRQRLAVVEANFGEAQFTAGKVDEAIASFERAASFFQDLGDRSNEAYARNNLGAAYERLGRLEEAAKTHGEALEAFRAYQDPYGEAMSLGNLGTAYHRLGQSRDALQALRRSLEIREALNDKAGQSLILQNLGFVELALERLRSALQASTLALELNRELANPLAEASCLANLASVFLALGRLNDAQDAAEKSQELFQARGVSAGLAIARWRLADVLVVRGELRVALRLYQTAAKGLNEARNAAGTAFAWLGMGRCFLHLGMLNKAKLALRRALSQFGLTTTGTGKAEICEALALLELRRGRLEAAKRSLLRARRLGKASSSRAVLARTDGLMGCLMAAQGKRTLAVRLLRRAIRRLRTLERAVDGYTELERLGQVLLEPDAGESLRVFEKLRDRATVLGLKSLQGRGELGIAAALNSAGLVELALDLLQQFQESKQEDRWLERRGWFLRAELFEATGQPGEAVKAKEKAESLIPGAAPGIHAGT